MAALEVVGASAEYGQRKVLQDFGMSVAAGELLAVVGHNGAGKTTALRVVAGLKKARRGSVLLEGKSIEGMSAYRRARAGLALVPEGVAGLFPSLTVRQNLEAVHVFAGLSAKRPEWTLVDEQLMDVFGEVLVKRSDQLAGSMSGGQRQMLALTLALRRRPSVLLLDEPSTGLAPVVVERIFDVIGSIGGTTGTAVVLVEQNLAAAMRIATRVVVVQSGRTVASFDRDTLPDATEVWTYF